MTTCVICKIIAGEIKSFKIFENEKALCVLDINPRSPGHTMVLPKKHCETILDLPGDFSEPLIEASRKTINLLNRTLKPDGYTLGINHGEASGQSVKHLHIHILPRWKEDKGGSVHSVVNNPPRMSLEEIRNKIIRN